MNLKWKTQANNTRNKHMSNIGQFLRENNRKSSKLFEFRLDFRFPKSKITHVLENCQSFSLGLTDTSIETLVRLEILIWSFRISHQSWDELIAGLGGVGIHRLVHISDTSFSLIIRNWLHVNSFQISLDFHTSFLEHVSACCSPHGDCIVTDSGFFKLKWHYSSRSKFPRLGMDDWSLWSLRTQSDSWSC